MANYNLTNQTISSSFEQLLQKDTDTGNLVNGLGEIVDGLVVTASYASVAEIALNVTEPTWNDITGKPTVVSGSSQIDYPLISNIPSGIVSSSEQLPSGLVSGSSQVSYPELSNIPSGIVSSSSQVVLEDTTFTDNGDKSFLQTDGAGNLSFQYVETVYETIRNMSGGPLDKGTPVYISGSTGDNGNAYVADASNPLKMPATYIVGEDLTDGEVGLAIVGGRIEGVNTTGFPAGTMIYVGEGGGWSDTRPSGSNSTVQLLGVVQKEGNGGQGIVINQLDAILPNIQEGYAWVGDANNQPQPIATSSFGGGGTIDTGSFATTGSNTFNGDETINGTNTIPGSTFTVKDGNNTNRIDVVNAALSGITGTDIILNGSVLNSGDLTVTGTITGTLAQEGTFATTGSNTFTGDQRINGTNTIPGSTFIAKDGNNSTRIQVNNAQLGGIVGVDVLMNGNTFLDGTVAIDDATRINGNLENTGSFTNGGDTTIVGTNLAPGNTFTANDGNGTPRLAVQNATLAGLTSVDVNINGRTQITDTLTLLGDEVVNGTNTIPGSTLDVKDGNGQTKLSVNNATLKGLTNTDVIVNGNTILSGDTTNTGKLSVEGELEVTGSVTLGRSGASNNVFLYGNQIQVSGNQPFQVSNGIQLSSGALNIQNGFIFNSGAFYRGVKSYSPSPNAGVTLEGQTGDYFIVNLPAGGNTDIGMSDYDQGRSFTIKIVQNATTAATVSLSTNFKTQGGVGYTVSSGLGAIDILDVRHYDSTAQDLYIVGIGQDFS